MLAELSSFFSPAGFDGIRCCLLRRFRLKWEHYIYLKRRTLCLKSCCLWGGLFILCAGLGFIPGFSQNVSAGAQAVLTVLAVAFFAPPACLIYGAKKEKDARTLKLVRGISLLSLGLTLLALVLNVLSAMGTVTMGNVLFAVLIVVSSPMVCSGYWALSLFLWACLLIVSHSLLRKNFN